MVDGEDRAPQNPLEVDRQLILWHLDRIVLVIDFFPAALDDQPHIVRDLTPRMTLFSRISHFIRLRQDLLEPLSRDVDLHRRLERRRGRVKGNMPLLQETLQFREQLLCNSSIIRRERRTCA